MERLFVLYDERCGVCRWARRWVETQPKFVETVFIPAGSEHARRLFPTLDHSERPEDLVVIGDGGEVYRGGAAWVMVLYALEDYREWSLRLGSPRLLPVARQAFHWVSTHRGTLSGWLGLDDGTLGRAFETQSGAVACEIRTAASAPGLQPGATGAGGPRAGQSSRSTPWAREFPA